MTKTLSANLGLNDLDAAFFTDDAPVLHAFVLAAIAFVILDWPENFGTEQAVAFRLERSVIDGLRLFDFSMRPLPDFIR